MRCLACAIDGPFGAKFCAECGARNDIAHHDRAINITLVAPSI
jgi:hypothetical protein